MRIAQIAPVWFPVPPKGYGGIELMVSLLADGLADAGHDVTLFASGGSVTRAQLVSPMTTPPDPRLLGNPWYDAFHALDAYLHVDAHASEPFDIVHDHAGIVGPTLGTLFAKLSGTPVFHTLHGPWTDEAKLLYADVAPWVRLVAISQAQQAMSAGIAHAGTVYNGIDVNAYPYRAAKEQRLVYIGRANSDKGPVEAIEIARQAGLPMTMILKRAEPPERAYFDAEVAPLLGDDIELLENVSHERKTEELGRACAFVFPIRWPEPFGLVMTEAMACGTPVVTTNWGAAPELVDDGVTGFRRETTAELVAAVARVGELDPAACRARVVDRFSAQSMVRGYEALFHQATQ
jgi:glycosyltransferase involved in cell wall biosynthesis